MQTKRLYVTSHDREQKAIHFTLTLRSWQKIMTSFFCAKPSAAGPSTARRPTRVRRLATIQFNNSLQQIYS